MSHERRPNTLFNMAFILVTVGAVSALGLAYTDHMTEKPRKEMELKKKIEAIQKVFPQLGTVQADAPILFFAKPDGTVEPLSAEEKAKLEEKEKFRVLEVFNVKKDGQPAGYAVKSFTERGYSGKFFIMVGFSPDGKITDTVVIDHKETPGLGTEMAKPKFKDQFIGKTLDGTFHLKVKKDGGSVDAITAATISSRAFCDAVGRAYKALCTMNGSLEPACRNLN